MEQTVLFEEKIYLTPKDMNRVIKKSINEILLDHLREKLENQCSQHGFIVPKSAEHPNNIQILSRSMGQLENGKYTGNIVFHIQLQATVYNPVNGTRIVGKILKKNKMGLYIIYKDAIRILIPRDLHLGNEEFENLQPDEEIEVEIRKSRFQIHDKFILSIGVYLGKRGSSVPIANQPDNFIENVEKQEAVEEKQEAVEEKQEAVEEKQEADEEKEGEQSESDTENEQSNQENADKSLNSDSEDELEDMVENMGQITL